MKGIFLMILCSVSLSCYAELSQLEDMGQYSVSSNRALVSNDDPLLGIDKIEAQVVKTLGNEVAMPDAGAFIPSQSSITVRDTGHTMTLKPILIQIGTGDF